MGTPELLEVSPTEVKTPSPEELEKQLGREKIAGRWVEVISRRPLKTNGCCTTEEIYVKGHHPMGTDVEDPWSHELESRLIIATIRPPHGYTVLEGPKRQKPRSEKKRPHEINLIFASIKSIPQLIKRI